MISVFADGESRHRLEDAFGGEIGWIRGRVIGFRGTRTEEEARSALVAVYPLLEAALRQHFPGWPHRRLAMDRVRALTDRGYEWFAEDGHPVARLHRPSSASGRTLFALEFVLPSFASEGVAISVAQVLGRALRPYLSDESSANGSALLPVGEDAADEAAAFA